MRAFRDGQSAQLGEAVPGASRPLSDEIVRQRLIDRLAHRWNASLTIIEAAAGFGKSIAISQAIRDNASDPTGIDLYLACRPPDADAAHLASRILPLLGGVAAPDAQTPLALAEAVCASLATHSPTSICLTLDDIHHVDNDGSATVMLSRLLRILPTNAHLVFSGRYLASFPLSRMAAADDIIRLSESELVFESAELEQLAAYHGRDPATLRTSAGWPALTRLALVVGSVAPIDFLIEEVVDALDLPHRRAVAATALAKRADIKLLQLVGAPVSRAVLATVPLITEHDDFTISAHDLWLEAIDRVLPPEELAALARHVSTWHSAASRYDEAIEVATTYEVWEEGLAAVLSAVGGGDPFPIAKRSAAWLNRFPERLHTLPELCLLRGAAARLAKEPDAGRADVEAALAQFQKSGTKEQIVAAGFEVGFSAWLRGDFVRVFDMYTLALELKASGHPAMDPLISIVQAVMADLEGDFVRARGHLDDVVLSDTPPALVLYVLRESYSLSFLLGDSKRCLETARSLRSWGDEPPVNFSIAVALWQHGEADELGAMWPSLRHGMRGNSQDDFLSTVFSTIIDASFGLVGDLTALDGYSTERSRERAFRSIALAAYLVTRGLEDEASAAIDRLVESGGLDDPLCRGELRRFLMFGYVLSTTVRATLDTDDLGPKLAERRSLARLFTRRRDGATVEWDELPDPPEVLCALPLAWSTELAALAVGDGHRRGNELATYLIDMTEGVAVDVLRRLAASPAAASSGAKILLEGIPDAPRATVRVFATGPIRVTSADPADSTILRRARVRELLALLLLRERVTVDQAVEVLWPDLGPAGARNNLRITLSFLRKLLEPGRPAGAPSYQARREGNQIWLRRSAALEADVWDIKRAIERGHELERNGQIDAAVDQYRIAARAWSGEVFEDLRYNLAAAAEVTHFDLSVFDATAKVAEWALAQSNPHEALTLGQRLLAHDPYSERAHLVLIGAHLLLDDTEAAAECVEACRGGFAELGVTPSAQAAMVFRRVAHRQSNVRTAG